MYVARSRNHCNYGSAKMRSVCIVDLPLKCQQYKTIECSHVNARMASLCTVASLQNISYSCQQYELTYTYVFM